MEIKELDKNIQEEKKSHGSLIENILGVPDALKFISYKEEVDENLFDSAAISDKLSSIHLSDKEEDHQSIPIFDQPKLQAIMVDSIVKEEDIIKRSLEVKPLINPFHQNDPKDIQRPIVRNTTPRGTGHFIFKAKRKSTSKNFFLIIF